jgi:hypothetical protein
MAMGTIAAFFFQTDTISDSISSLKEPITEEELKMLTEFNLADSDGELDKTGAALR